MKLQSHNSNVTEVSLSGLKWTNVSAGEHKNAGNHRMRVICDSSFILKLYFRLDFVYRLPVPRTPKSIGSSSDDSRLI